jgi:hypothetical protein
MIWPEDLTFVLDSSYVYEIEDIIADINKRTHRRLELHPFWKYPIWTKSGEFLHFKLRDRSERVEQIMDLGVAEKDFAAPARTKKLTDAAVSDIILRIEAFFQSGGQEEKHSAVSTAADANQIK